MTPSRPGCPSLPSLPGSPGMEDVVVAGHVSAAAVLRFMAVKQVRATRSLTVRGSILTSNSICFQMVHQKMFLLNILLSSFSSQL